MTAIHTDYRIGDRHVSDYYNGQISLTIGPYCRYIIPDSIQLQNLNTVTIIGCITISLNAFRHCTTLKSIRVVAVTVIDQKYVLSKCLRSITVRNTVLENSTLADLLSTLPITVRELELDTIGICTGDHDMNGISRLINLESMVLEHVSDEDRYDKHVIYPVLQLPEDMSGLTALRNLRVNGCDMASIPDSLYTLTGLRCIDMSDNRLNDMSVLERMCGLTNLGEISLSYNGISGTLPPDSSMSKLSNLQILYISNNDITGGLTDEWIESMPRLKHILINNNERLTATVNADKDNILQDIDCTNIEYIPE